MISPFTTGYEGTAIDSLYPSNTDMFRLAAEQGALGGYVHPWSREPEQSGYGVARGFPVDDGLATPSPYASPEERDRRELDARSDFYSLGIILYEMLVGPSNKPPGARLELPEQLSEFQPVINGMLAEEPANRFESADDLIGALQQDHSRKETKPLAAEGDAPATGADANEEMDQRTTRRFIDQADGDEKNTRKVRLRDRRTVQALVWTGIALLGVFLAAASVLAIQWILDRL